MSIYRNPNRAPFSDNDVRSFGQRLAKGEAEAAPATADSGAAKWGHLRKTIPMETLLPATVSWAARLPAEVRPIALMKQYARVANRVAASWRSPDAFFECIGDLLIDRRGGRRGFPSDVSRDLFRLRDYYETMQAAEAPPGGTIDWFAGRRR